jgi:hypothetical protein
VFEDAVLAFACWDGEKPRKTSAGIADYEPRMPNDWTVAFDIVNYRKESSDDV